MKVLGLAKSSSTCLECPGFGKLWARVCAQSWLLVPAHPSSNNNLQRLRCSAGKGLGVSQAAECSEEPSCCFHCSTCLCPCAAVRKS